MWIWYCHLLGYLISTLVPDSFCPDFSLEVETCLSYRIVKRINWDKISGTGVGSLPFFPYSIWPSLQLVNIISPLHNADHLVVHLMSWALPVTVKVIDLNLHFLPSNNFSLVLPWAIRRVGGRVEKGGGSGRGGEKPKARYHLLSR